MKNAKRYLAVVLSFALFLALPLAFTQEAAAASKTKIYQPSLVVTSESDSDGDTSTDMDAYFYNNKGLMSQIVDKNGASTVFTYNKSGYETSEAELDKDGKPYSQSIFDVKKGKTKAASFYFIDDGKAELETVISYTYKNGKVSKIIYASADGKRTMIATYKKGNLSKVVYANTANNYQAVNVYDKYGNITSKTEVWPSSNRTTVYKNTYKNDKLVKTVWAESNSQGEIVESGLNVYTYKNGKLVKRVAAYTYNSEPDYTYGDTYTYAYTKGGLIKTEAYAHTWTTPTETKITWSRTTAYQYKKVAVNSKCVKAVNEAMENYCYENYLPGNVIDMGYYFYG